MALNHGYLDIRFFASRGEFVLKWNINGIQTTDALKSSEYMLPDRNDKYRLGLSND